MLTSSNRTNEEKHSKYVSQLQNNIKADFGGVFAQLIVVFNQRKEKTPNSDASCCPNL